MVFKAQILDVAAFKEMLRALSVVNNEPTISFLEDGLTCDIMDGDHVTMIQWRLDPKALLNHYDCGDESTKVTLDVSQFLKFIDGFNKGDELSLELDEDKNRMLVKGRVSSEKGIGRAKNFSVPILETELLETPTPKIFYKAKAKIVSQPLFEALKDCQLVGEMVGFEIGDKLTIKGNGDMGSALNEWEKGSDDLIELKYEEVSTSSYINDKLVPVVAAAVKCGEVVTLELTTDMPIRLDFETAYGKLVYHVAPCIGR